MRNHLSIVLLSLVLIALVWDIAIRSQPVHAQNDHKVYIDNVVNSMGQHELNVRGGEVLAFSCTGDNCYVLSSDK
jgi:hypothetical protein